MTPVKLQTKQAPLASLELDQENDREHPADNLAVIRASLEQWGQLEPLVVQQSSGRVIGGNGRLLVMRDLGWSSAAIVELDVNDDEARAIAHVLNRSGDLAAWNVERVQSTVGALQRVGFRVDLLKLDDILPPTAADQATEIREWTAEQIHLTAVFTFRAPIELQGKIRDVLHERFPGVTFEEEVISA